MSSSKDFDNWDLKRELVVHPDGFDGPDTAFFPGAGSTGVELHGGPTFYHETADIYLMMLHSLIGSRLLLVTSRVSSHWVVVLELRVLGNDHSERLSFCLFIRWPTSSTVVCCGCLEHLRPLAILRCFTMALITA